MRLGPRGSKSLALLVAAVLLLLASPLAAFALAAVRDDPFDARGIGDVAIHLMVLVAAVMITAAAHVALRPAGTDSPRARLVHRSAMGLSTLTVLAILVPLVPMSASGHSRMNARYWELGIATGQIRTTRYVWFVPVSRAIEETMISRARREMGPWPTDPEWRIGHSSSSTSSARVNWAFGGELANVRMLEKLDADRGVPADRRIEVARVFLEAWVDPDTEVADQRINDILLELIDGR